VILGKRLHGVSADQINSAVADLGGDAVVAAHHEHRHGGAHALLLGIVLRQAEDHIGRSLDGALDDSNGLPKRVLRGVTRRNAIESIGPPGDHAVHRAHGLLAGELAGGVTTHPIGYDVQAQIVVDKERVLVRLSALSDIGQPCTMVLQLIPFSSGARQPALALSD